MLSGVIPILLTPFTEEGEIDKEGLVNLIQYYIKEHASALVCFGEVSEPDTLSEEEKQFILETTKNHANKTPLIAGISSDDIGSTIKAAEIFSDIGVTGYLLAPPKKPDLSQQSIYEFYKAVDQKVDFPIIIHDLPAGIRPLMSPELIVKIVRNTEHVRYWKAEDQPTQMKIEKVNSFSEDKLIILGASHGRNFFWELERGAKGIMTSTPMPEILSLIHNNYIAGNIDLARDIFYISTPLNYYYSNSPVVIKKEILKYNGHIKSSRMREVSPILTNDAVKDLIELVEWAKKSIEVRLSSK